MVKKAPSPTIVLFKILRDMLYDFSEMVERLSNTKKTYGISYDEIKTQRIFESKTVKELTKQLTPEQLGLLMVVSSEINETKSKFQSFMDLDQKELVKFHKQLKKTTEKLNKILEDK